MGLVIDPTQRILRSPLTEVSTSSGGSPFTLISGTAYFVYLGYTLVPFTPKFVEWSNVTVGAGAQTAECGFFSSPSAPNKAGQNLTTLVSSGVLTNLTNFGMNRNNVAFATAIVAGVHVWAGIRTVMAVTQPHIVALFFDYLEGSVLSLAGSGALTGAGPFAGAIIAGSDNGVAGPSLRGTLD